jgi:hypothetical protein
MIDHGQVQLAPIGGADLGEVGAFLHAELNPRLSAEQWARSIVPTWRVNSPNHGFLLRAEGQVVGVQLAFYSEREVGDSVVDVCNVGAWCVLEEYRNHGVRLLRAVLAQRAYHITDLSPSGNVVPLNQKLGFEALDTYTVLVPHRPLARARGARVVTDPAVIEPRLLGRDLTIFRDHQGAAAAHHLLLVCGGEQCYLVVRRERRKDLPVFASLLHVGNPELLRRHLGLLGRHLLLRHGVVGTLLELRLVGERPSGSVRLARPRPKMFRRARGSAGPVPVPDGLYSELALVAW